MRREEYSEKLLRIFRDSTLLDEHPEMPKSITFQVTEDCNLRCTYCYQTIKKKNRMSFETAKEFIDMILEDPDRCNGYINPNDNIGVILDFIGGEPLLEIDLIDQIVDYFRERTFILKHHWATNFMISISSNGMLYFDEKVQKFIKKNKEHLSFSISIDGNKKLHDSCRLDVDGNGTYDRAMKAAKHYMNELHLYMGSKITLAPENINYTSEAIIALMNEGYNEINFNCVFEEGWTIEHARIYYKELKKLADYVLNNDLEKTKYLSQFNSKIGHPLDEKDNNNWCGGDGKMIALDYKGDIFPCLRYMETSLDGQQEPYVIGNIKDGIAKCESHCNRCSTLENITRRSQSTDECFDCPIASMCAWCSAHNYQIYGTPNKRATFICNMYKSEVLANIYFWNKYYKKNNMQENFEIHIPKDWALEIIDEEEYMMLKELAEKGGDE